MWWTWIAVGLLVLLQWRLLDGFWRHLDLHAADGVLYLQNGVLLAQGEVAPLFWAWSPVLGGLYMVFEVVGVPLEHRQDVMAVVVTIATTLLLFGVLRRLVGGPPALLVAACWAASPVALHAVGGGTLPPPTYLVSAALALAGIRAMLSDRRLLAIALLLLAVLNRGEFALPLLGAGAVGWFVVRRRAFALLLLAVGGVGLAVQQTYGAARDRAWFAFRQHYAGMATERGSGLPGASFHHPDPIITRDFPGADSPFTAIVTAPDLVLRHVGANCVDLGGAVGELLQPFRHAGWWQFGLALALAAITARALARRARLGKLLRTRSAALAMTAAAGLAAVLPPLLLYPRGELMLPLLLPVAVLLGLLLRAGVGVGRPAAWASIGAVAVLALTAPGPYGTGASAGCEARAVLRLVARQEWRADDRVYVPWLIDGMWQPGRFQVLRWIDHLGRSQADCAALFAATEPTALLVGPSQWTDGGGLGALLAEQLVSGRWIIADFSALTVLMRRAP